jgi:group I intron endonuclease
VNGKCYIGSALNFKKRWRDHRRQLTNETHNNPKLQAAWNKYGADVFEFETIAYCPKEHLLWQEQLAIDAFKAFGEGYNLCPTAGSRLGSVQPQSAKEQISQSLLGNQRAKGMKHTDVTLAKIGAASKGNKYAVGSKGRRGQVNSPEHRQKLSESHKGVRLSEDHKQRIAAANVGIARTKGIKLSDEARRNISEGHKGKKYSEAHRQAIKDGWARRRLYLQNKLPISLNEYAGIG